jgi:hypothetical protein
MTAGAAIAIGATLFAIGPGDLFPIVIAAGTMVAGVAATAGTIAGHRLRHWLSRLNR